jgi:hypothetical protein
MNRKRHDMLPSTSFPCFPRNGEASSKNNQGFNGGGPVTGENDEEDDIRRSHGGKGHQGDIDCPFIIFQIIVLRDIYPF